MIPSHLYHYTSIDTLKLILKNENIRFTRIDLLNDPLEGNLMEFTHHRKFVFITSWTANERDEIPMWKIYSGLDGVRIRMPIDLFCNDEGLQVEKKEDFYDLVSSLERTYSLDSEMNGKKNINPNGPEIQLEIIKVYGPRQIIYEDEIKCKTITKEQVKSTKNTNFESSIINFNQIGVQKSTFWQFENEYRFRIYPFQKIIGSTDILDFDIDLKDRCLDINFNKSALNELELLFGPNTTDEQIQSIAEILKTKGIQASWKRSTVKIIEKSK